MFEVLEKIDDVESQAGELHLKPDHVRVESEKEL